MALFHDLQTGYNKYYISMVISFILTFDLKLYVTEKQKQLFTFHQYENKN